jgi:hypothetical protein
MGKSRTAEQQAAHVAYHVAYRAFHPDKRKYAERCTNKRLRLTNTYSRMKQRVAGKYLRVAKFYMGLPLLSLTEFLAWAEPHKDFNRLFDEWVASGRQRRLSPSIDRVDPRYGYVLHNMQWLTLAHNSGKAKIQQYYGVSAA